MQGVVDGLFIYSFGACYPVGTVGPSYSLDRRDFFFSFLRVLLLSILTPLLSIIFFSCFFVLFKFGSSHAQVFGKLLVHAFHISYRYIDWYLLYFDIATASAQHFEIRTEKVEILLH